MKEKLLLGLPELASEHGEMVDHMMLVLTLFMALLFVFWSTFLGFAIYRFRARKNPQASYHGITSHWSSHLEIGVIIVEAVLLLGFAFPLWINRVTDYPTGEDVVQVRAVGEKFFWTFHYPGEDGKFGRIDPFLISSSNVIGLDPDDPNSADDVLVRNELALPVRRHVVVEVTAKDVIHNLHLIPMRMAQDAIPGTRSHVWFRPIKTGEWDILCGQLCGPGHANMGAKLVVQEEADFDSWISGQPVFKKPEAPAATAKASSAGGVVAPTSDGNGATDA